jgi:lysyl-tRNA synthetase class 2
MWLQTSPEFAMKRLLAAGGQAIYQITRAFRGAEIGARHNPEFTMVEWYRRGDNYTAAMQLLDDLASELLGLGPAERLTYGDAFSRYAGVDPHRASTPDLVQAVRQRGISAPESLAEDDRDAWLDLLLTELVEPKLGFAAPAILCDYPASQAALAVVRDEDPPVAERFELYVRGIELANGYHELLDANVLRRRNDESNALRVVDGKPSLPVDSRLLTAMERGLPACSGVALGFDRVVMLAAGVKTIAQVLAFPIDRA